MKESFEKIVSPYFGTEGLSSASATHTAEMAKERSFEIEKKLELLCFTKTEEAFPDSHEFVVTQIGCDFLEKIPAMLEEYSEYAALIAWLREAVKEKGRLQKECDEFKPHEENELSSERWDLKTPVKKTKEDIISEMSVLDRQRYLSLEAKASKIGKFIHPKGSFAVAREELQKKIQRPADIGGSSLSGRYVIRYTPTVDAKAVDDTFFSLQSEQRKAQAELNGILHGIEETIRKDYNKRMEEYDDKIREIERKVDALREEVRKAKDMRSKEIESLKIVIPNNLKAVYAKVQGR